MKYYWKNYVQYVELGNKEHFGQEPKIVPNTKFSLLTVVSYEVNWQIGHRKWFLNTKFDCISILINSLTFGYSIENNKRSLIDVWMIFFVKYTHYV